MTPDISVVVPVYNPGSSIEPCIASMLAQTLPADRFEVVFVDDGSTDEAPARLDALAEEHPNVRVIHTPNSGWAGRPRNIGMDAARGRYIQLVDQDDAITPRALERLVAMGDRNGSDIVIGKVASDFRTVPLGVFRENRERCTITDAPLIDSLTPHKAFRTAFLRDHELRFAEGRRRLEDQLFMVQSYFAAKTVSILADEVIYRYMGRPDRANTSYSATTAEAYLGNLREVVDVVVANTSPGGFRDTLLRRFVRVEMLNRLSDRRFSSMPADAQAAWFAATRPLVLDFAGPRVEAGLEPLDQARLRLLRSGDVEGLALLATRTTSIRAEATLSTLTWLDGRLRLRLTCRLVMGDGSPLTLRPTKSGWILHEPLTEGILDEPVGWAGDRYRPRVSVAFRDQPSGEEWALTATTVSDGPGGAIDFGGTAGVAAPRPVDLSVTAGGDPSSLGAGRPLPVGSWRVQARIQVAGIDRRVNVSVPATASNPVGIAVLGAEPVVFVAGRADDGALTVAIESGAVALGLLLVGRALRWAPTDGRRLDASFVGVGGPRTRPIPVRLGIVAGESRRWVPAVLRTDAHGLRLSASAASADDRPGAARLELDFGDDSEAIDLGAAEIVGHGRVYPAAAARTGMFGILGRRTWSAVADAGRRLRAGLRLGLVRGLHAVRRRTGLTRRDPRLTQSRLGTWAIRLWDRLPG